MQVNFRGRRFDHIFLILVHLYWLPVSIFARFNVSVVTYKVLNGLGPPYLLEYLSPQKIYLVNPFIPGLIIEYAYPEESKNKNPYH